MWKVFAFLFILFPFLVYAECVSVKDVTKCARLPERFSIAFTRGGTYTDDSWSVEFNDIVYSGNGAEYDSRGYRCVVNSPFNAVIQFVSGPIVFGSAYEACANMFHGEMTIGFTVDGRLDDDMCPDGFYTVPYEISCGEGFVDATNVPRCADDMSGDFCLLSASAAPCAAGVTTIRTGTGVVVSLWAEKTTQPSLCVKYNDTICYANLEIGTATEAININYNGVIYHTVD